MAYSDKDNNREIVLEDFPIRLTCPTAELPGAASAMPDMVKKLVAGHITEGELEKRLVVVSDNLFTALVKYATQVIARNQLNEDTKKSKNLWYEETVPPDAVFYTLMKPITPVGAELVKLDGHIGKKLLQFGGNETIGYGIVKMSADLSASLTPATGAGGGANA